MSDAASAAKPKPYTLAPDAGGRYPDLGQLFSATMAEFTDHLSDYVLLGLGHMLVVLPVVFGLIFVLYFGMTVFFLGGFVGSAVLGGIAAQGMGEDFGALVMSGGTLVTAILAIVGALALVVGAAALVAPFSASVNRAVARHQRGGEKMVFQDAFSTLTQDLPSVVVGAVLLVSGTLVGLLFCYLPGIAFSLLLSMAPLLIALHRRRAFEAFGQAFRDMNANPAWHLQFAGVYFVVAMIASYIPILGPMFLVSLHVRAYRMRYGDGVEPASA